jgi:IS5 family transposase
LGFDEEVPDDTTLVKFRRRLGEEGIRKVFDEVNGQWAAAGLIGEERRVLDGVHLWANVARRSLEALLRKGREVILETLGRVDAAAAAELRREYGSESVPGQGSREERVAQEAERTGALVERLEKHPDQGLQARLQQVKTLLSGEADHVVSFDDPDARWGHKSPEKVFCGYKAHEALDPDSRLITGVKVVAGNAHEGVQTDALLEVQSPPLREGTTIIADGYYNNATTVAQVEQAGMRPCFAGLSSERVSDEFRYQAQEDRMLCRAEKHSVGKVRVGNGDLYYFSMKDCASCPLRKDCLTPGEDQGKAEPRRRVYLSDVRKAKIVAGEAGAQWRKEQLKIRYHIESKFSEQAKHHQMRHARYWGLVKVTVHVLLNAITVNTKRAARLLLLRARPLAPAVALAATG